MIRSSLPLVAALLAALPASASLRDEPRITEGLITVGIAFEISELCPSIDARRLRGLSYLLSLRSTARGLGYSAAEVDAFIDDDAEKDRLKIVARDRLTRMGAPREDVQAHCRVGRTEVERDSQIGRLLAPR